MSDIDRDFARLEGGEGITTPAKPPASVRARTLALTPQPILTLETIAPKRPMIRIDGLDYLLSLYEDFSLWQHARLADLSGRAGEIDALALADDAAEVTIEQFAELDRVALVLYADMVGTVLPNVPAPTRAALTLPQLQAVMREFFALNQSQSAGTEATASAAPPTGVRSSPPSSPTAATGAGGRGKRRSAKFARPTGESSA